MNILRDRTSVARKPLTSSGKLSYLSPLPPLPSVTLLFTRKLTNGDAVFFISYIASIPIIRTLRNARWSLLQSLANLRTPALKIGFF